MSKSYHLVMAKKVPGAKALGAMSLAFLFPVSAFAGRALALMSIPVKDGRGAAISGLIALASLAASFAARRIRRARVRRVLTKAASDVLALFMSFFRDCDGAEAFDARYGEVMEALRNGKGKNDEKDRMALIGALGEYRDVLRQMCA